MSELSKDSEEHPSSQRVAAFLLGTVGGEWFRCEYEDLDFTVYTEMTYGPRRSVQRPPADLDPDKIGALAHDLKKLSQDPDLAQHLADGAYDTFIARARAFIDRILVLASGGSISPHN